MKKISLLLIPILLLGSLAFGQTFYSWRYLESANCDAETSGKARDLCHDTGNDNLYKCEPSAGDCDTAGEWKQITSEIITEPTLTLQDANGAAPTTNGQIKYDRTTERLEVGDGAATKEFLPFGTLTDTKFCIYDSASGTIICDSAAGSGATTELDNLGTVAINTNLISDTDSTDDLGSAAKYWANAYVDEVYTPAVQFPASQSASADANTLDDYEEGTWTPTIAFGGNAVGVTYNASFTTGIYTKIGNLVNVSTFVIMTSKGSSNGSATIEGLPFTIANTNAARGGAAMALTNVTFANQHQSQPVLNTTQVELTEITEGGTQTALTDANFANDSRFAIGWSYRVQ